MLFQLLFSRYDHVNGMAVYINHVILDMHQDFGEQNLDFETLSSLIQAPSLRLFLFFIFFGSYIEHFLPFMSEN